LYKLLELGENIWRTDVESEADSFLGAVRIDGIMTDCPEKLTTGIGLVVTLKFYLLPSAFSHPSTSAVPDDLAPRHMFNEGAETQEEE